MNIYPPHPFQALACAGLEELPVESSCKSDLASKEHRVQFAAFYRLAEEASRALETARKISYVSVLTGQKSQYTTCSSRKIEEASTLLFLKNNQTVYFDGGVCQGIFGRDGLCIYGSVKYADGSFYEGSFDQGMPHGLGCLIGSDGTLYEGLFYRGELEGQGRMQRVDGSFYEGPFEKGLPNGVGRFTYSNGDVYIGQFSQGYFHGYGRLIFASQEKYYIGQFEKNVFHGPGRFVCVNESVCKGFFEFGRLVGDSEMITVPPQWYPENFS